MGGDPTTSDITTEGWSGDTDSSQPTSRDWTGDLDPSQPTTEQAPTGGTPSSQAHTAGVGPGPSGSDGPSGTEYGSEQLRRGS